MNLESNVQIGDFRIIRRLGAGGMGVVYQAQQISLNRTVALKVLGRAMAHPGDILRFRREAQAAAKLKHPGIATVYCVEQDEIACYMAMEFIDGITLRDVIVQLGTSRNPNLSIQTVLSESSGEETKPPRVLFSDPTAQATADVDQAEPMPLLEAITPEAEQLISSRDYIRRLCEIMRDTARALLHAHDHGIVHRDLKPQNIMLDRQGGVHIIDFGVARFFEGATLTHTGALIGTPMYMSPEQVAGRHVDHRSDIYSLGLVMYELLTLRRPLHAPTREAVLRGIVTKAMAPVSWKNSGIPRDVESVVHKAMAKDPDERYQNAGEFADDIHRCLEKQPVVAEPYRYKFDTREIVAERPWGMTATAFWFFMVAIFYGLICMPYQIGMSVANPAGRRVFPESPAEYVLVVGGYLSLAAVALVVAAGLLSGLKWCRWLGLPVAVVGLALSVQQPFTVLQAFWQYKNYGYLALMSMWLVMRFVVLAGGAFAVFVLLIDRSTKQWFRYASHLRAEHDQLATTLRGTGLSAT